MKYERCPECGCPTFIMPDHLGEGYRICSKCKQEWWENIDYGTGTKPEPDCINPDCIGGWMTEHEDLTELTIPCGRCNADRHKAKPFFAPKVTVHPRQPEPEQDVIMRQFEKCWHGVFDHLDKMLLIQITDVFRSGFKSGYTSRNAEIEALNETHELETKGRDELRRADVDCILRLREENRKQTEEIEALKYQLEGFKSQYNEDEKMISALKAEIAKNKRKAEKWDNLAQEMKCSDGGQYYNDMISAITAKINAEVIPLKAEIESLRCCGNCSLLDDCIETKNCNVDPADICDNWIPKSKLCKDSTTTIQESPCNH